VACTSSRQWVAKCNQMSKREVWRFWWCSGPTSPLDPQLLHGTAIPVSPNYSFATRFTRTHTHTYELCTFRSCLSATPTRHDLFYGHAGGLMVSPFFHQKTLETCTALCTTNNVTGWSDPIRYMKNRNEQDLVASYARACLTSKLVESIILKAWTYLYLQTGPMFFTGLNNVWPSCLDHVPEQLWCSSREVTTFVLQMLWSHDKVKGKIVQLNTCDK
jgi:hypothetical protein